MNRGIVLKSIRETWFITLLLGVGLLAAEALFAYIFPLFFEEYAQILETMTIFRTVLKALLGTDIGDSFGPQTFGAIAWVHPVVLAIVWAHGIVLCTRIPAGEIDRGTADVLFGLPVSRERVYLSDGVVWLAAAFAMLPMALIGSAVGWNLSENAEDFNWGRVVVVLLNLYCLAIAVGGVSCLVSSLSDRRGRAIATVFGIVLASFLLNFLAQFWVPASRVSVLGILNYYQPVLILRDGGWPLGDMAVLLGVGAGTWLLGGFVLSRRDICTV